ncbi:uncharacterized protein METZ01_LOCUS420377, partial [marine metagenome]
VGGISCPSCSRKLGYYLIWTVLRTLVRWQKTAVTG